MKRTLLCLFLAVSAMCWAQEERSHKILLTGASFASPNNGWFELACKHLDATPVNKAVGAEAIADAANRIIDGTLYTIEELDEIDVLVLMHVHDKDVAEQSQIKKDYKDYKTPFDRSNYAAAYDYVIKRYISDCYNLKFHRDSRYYGSYSGKPAVIVLCTDWHDLREAYNNSVRVLAQRWGLPLVEFDKNIGFSKNQVHPATGEPHNQIYALDQQEIDGVKYGWHPLKGKTQYIQQRMATIFVDAMRKVLLVK